VHHVGILYGQWLINAMLALLIKRARLF